MAEAASGTRFHKARNEVTRIDRFEELSHTALAALRSFCRRLGAPHLLDELILPTLHDGQAQLFAAVRDRPWPPWGVGARHVSGLCMVQAVADESYAIGPIWVTDEDLTNVGLLSALYKEVLESIATSPKAEVNYLAADGSVLANHVLASIGFKRYDDVFLTEGARYLTYRIPAEQLLENLGLRQSETPDLLAHAVPVDILVRNASLHNTIYLGSRAEWMGTSIYAELINLVRGGHAGKPGGVPSGTGRFGWETINPADPFVVTLENFLGNADSRKLLDYAVSHQAKFAASTVKWLDKKKPSVDERLRRSKTFDKLGEFEKLFTAKLKEVIAPSLQRIKHPGFKMGKIEMQITASGDGDYFRLHRDTDKNDTREIAFVYHFHGEPRGFSGGELRVFANRQVGGDVQPTDRSQILSPRQDQLLLFPAVYEHELLPVRVPSKQFSDSRFTVNGWIHRA